MDNCAKIVIVDDEKMVLKPLKMLLELEGYKDVFCFENPLLAIDFLKNNFVDLIISDFIMPEMNGIEFLAEAKKYCPDTTQILLTGYADKENAIKAINDLQIYKYIEKPWDNEDFLINIKNGIERTHLKDEINRHINELEILNRSLEKKVEERTSELKNINLKLQTIISSCADGIIIFDNNFKITLANTACENLFQLKENELVGKNFFEIIINEKDKKIFDDLKDNKTLYLRDFYIINYRDNRRIPVEINIARIENSYKNYIASIRDVSYQKEIEELKDDFIATLTHDLRTPILASIRGLEFLLSKNLGSLTDKQELTLDTMKRSQEDVLGLVNALLEVYRYESGKLMLTKTQFCLNRLIDDSISELVPLINEKSILIKKQVYMPEGEFLINADRGEIKRVIINLLSNAIKHSNNNSEIIIKTDIINKKDIIFSIQDFGCGMDEDDLSKLFKRFSQGTNRKRACSTGLGLYLSRQIVEAHNGKIWAESEVNKGSTFNFILKSVITENRVLI